MTPTLAILCLIPVAYLIGSIPTGLLVGFARGVDVRTFGSGNIGATNVGRMLGGKYFALVFILDALKGALPVAAAGWLLHSEPADRVHYLLWLAVGAAALLGNLYSLFMKFKGGKGVAVSTGITLGIFPYFTVPVLGCVAVFLIVFGIWRYISLASILSAGSFPIFYVILGFWGGWNPIGDQLPLLVFALAVPAMIIWRHRGNLVRLRAGTEHRFSSKRS